jgi:hypothetical protein
MPRRVLAIALFLAAAAACRSAAPSRFEGR